MKTAVALAMLSVTVLPLARMSALRLRPLFVPVVVSVTAPDEFSAPVTVSELASVRLNKLPLLVTAPSLAI